MKKKLMAFGVILLLLPPFVTKADAGEDYVFSFGGAINGLVMGGSIFGHHHHNHHNNWYPQQDYGYPPPQGGYEQQGGYYPPPPPMDGGDGCSFKSKMQGQVKCGSGNYTPPPPVAVPVAPSYGQCVPYYYKTFVQGYGWQIMRNYRC